MATKTLSITEEAYNKLASLKKTNESFSLVIQRITGKHKLSDIRGILSKETTDKLEKTIKEGRKLHKRLREDRMKGAIAITNNEVLLTRNKKHFEKIKGLKIENY